MTIWEEIKYTCHFFSKFPIHTVLFSWYFKRFITGKSLRVSLETLELEQYLIALLAEQLRRKKLREEK